MTHAAPLIAALAVALLTPAAQADQVIRPDQERFILSNSQTTPRPAWIGDLVDPDGHVAIAPKSRTHEPDEGECAARASVADYRMAGPTPMAPRDGAGTADGIPVGTGDCPSQDAAALDQFDPAP